MSELQSANETIMQIILQRMAQENPEKFLQNNSQLQSKKNQVRKELSEMGILKKEGHNTFDKYKYFSEAQYKELFTNLFSRTRLELKSSVISCQSFQGTDKQPFGRQIKLEFCLMDCETGFFELSYMIGEGIDKGDKASYKANTGAIKYYLANTFLVATGDDPENETQSNTTEQNKKTQKQQSSGLVTYLEKVLTVEEKQMVLSKYKVDKLEQLNPKVLNALAARKKGIIAGVSEAC